MWQIRIPDIRMSNDTSAADVFELDPKTKYDVWVGLRVFSTYRRYNETGYR